MSQIARSTILAIMLLLSLFLPQWAIQAKDIYDDPRLNEAFKMFLQIPNGFNNGFDFREEMLSGDPKIDIASLSKTLAQARSTFGNTSIQYGRVLYRIGRYRYEMKDYNGAAQNFEKLTKIFEADINKMEAEGRYIHNNEQEKLGSHSLLALSWSLRNAGETERADKISSRIKQFIAKSKQAKEFNLTAYHINAIVDDPSTLFKNPSLEKTNRIREFRGGLEQARVIANEASLKMMDNLVQQLRNTPSQMPEDQQKAMLASSEARISAMIKMSERVSGRRLSQDQINKIRKDEMELVSLRIQGINESLKEVSALIEPKADEISNTARHTFSAQQKAIESSPISKGDSSWREYNVLLRQLKSQQQSLGEMHPEVAYTLQSMAYLLAQSKASRYEAFEKFIHAKEIIHYNLQHTMSLSSEEDRLLFIKRNDIAYDAALSLLVRYFPNNQQALQLALAMVLTHKGSVLDALTRQQRLITQAVAGKESFQQEMRKRNALRATLIEQLFNYDKSKLEHIKTLKRAIQESDRFFAQQVIQDSSLFSNNKPLSSKMVAKKLQKGMLLLEFVHWVDVSLKNGESTGNDHYLLFILDNKNSIQLINLGEAKKIDRTLEVALKAIQSDQYSVSIAAASQLYQLLWSPIAALVGHAPHLIISPDHMLNKVPFAALRSPDERYLIEKKSIMYVTSGRDLVQANTKKSSTSEMVIFAYPDYGDPKAKKKNCTRKRGLSDQIVPFCALKNTLIEAKEVASSYHGLSKLFIGKEASKRKLLSLPVVPKVLHIATHGFFLQHAEIELNSPEVRLIRSGLAFSNANRASIKSNRFIGSLDTRELRLLGAGLGLDKKGNITSKRTDLRGILTALEVSSMNLQGTDLVTLSACQTGLGEIEESEGVYGLRRSFIIAGAKNLMVTLWSIDDVAAKILMPLFYHYYSKGEPPTYALQKAQLQYIQKLRKLNNAAPPSLWAPFLLQGTNTQAM